MKARDAFSMDPRQVEARVAQARLRAEHAITSQDREHHLGMAGYWAEILCELRAEAAAEAQPA